VPAAVIEIQKLNRYRGFIIMTDIGIAIGDQARIGIMSQRR